MREIKFRAWHKVRLGWIAGFNMFGFSNYKTGDKHLQRFGSEFPASDLDIEQFTGLLDKNGTEIYEGDIIICCNNTISEIKFGEFDYKCDCIEGDYIDHIGFYFSHTMEPFAAAIPTSQGYEVIGNIHESPSLLEA